MTSTVGPKCAATASASALRADGPPACGTGKASHPLRSGALVNRAVQLSHAPEPAHPRARPLARAVLRGGPPADGSSARGFAPGAVEAGRWKPTRRNGAG